MIRGVWSATGLPLRGIGIVLCALCAPVTAQIGVSPTAGAVRIFNTDMAVLEAQDVRKDLGCTVTPDKPLLGFDLRFDFSLGLHLRHSFCFEFLWRGSLCCFLSPTLALRGSG